MKDTMRIDEIDDYLKNGGSIDNIRIEQDPSHKSRVWSLIGAEIDMDKDRRTNGYRSYGRKR